MKKTTLLLALFSCFNLITMAQNNNAFAVQNTIENGIIEGNYDTKSGIQTYFGIPFAKPPVGELRWKAPQPLNKWQGVKETKKFAARPMQKLIWGEI
jgi:para-nitrobenzyl esterase